VLVLEGELREDTVTHSRPTYHVAGTDAADVGDLARSLPVGHDVDVGGDKKSWRECAVVVSEAALRKDVGGSRKGQ